MPDVKNIEAVMESALSLSFDEWLKVSKAITRAFEEQERRAREGLRLNNTERCKYFYAMDNPFDAT